MGDLKPEVLLLRFGSLGDVILATAAAGCLRAARPECRITFLTKEPYRPVLEGNPAIDRVVGIDPRAGVRALVGLCRRLGPFDAVVDLHDTPRSRIAAAVLPAGRRMRYRKSALRRRLWAMGWMRSGMRGQQLHVIERYLRAMEGLGVEGTVFHPQVCLSDDERRAAARFLGARGVRDPRKTAVIVPGAKWPNKRWGTEGFAAVGRWLSEERSLELVVAGDEQDRPAAAELMTNLPEGAVDITGQTDIRGLASILQLAAIAVGNDSGPGHLAAAVGTPVVTVFGPTSEAFGFAPRGAAARTVSLPLECRPCSLHGGLRCRQGRRACLDDLSPEKVIAAVQSALA